MEPFLNSVWALVAIASLFLWFRLAPRATGERVVSIVALAMLLLILFPVISVSDDLWSLQNPAEAVSSQRRDHNDHRNHANLPAVAGLPLSTAAALNFGVERFTIASNAFNLLQDNPALDPIQNRPPPAA